MVRVFPLKALQRPPDLQNSLNNPNRFKSKEYDRSSSDSGSCKRMKDCQCMACAKVPIVLLCPEAVAEKNNSSVVNVKNVEELIDGHVLETVHPSSFFIYAQTFGCHTQIGLCAALSIEDCFNNVVKRHENTIQTCEHDSLSEVDILNQTQSFSSSSPHKSANVDPVMILYRDNKETERIINRVMETNKPISSTRLTPDSLHEVWVVDDENDIREICLGFEGVDSLYIADGHHRTAYACRLAKLYDTQKKRSFWHSRHLVGLLFPKSQLRVVPFGRCLKSLGGLSTHEFMTQVEKKFTVSIRPDLKPQESPRSISACLSPLKPTSSSSSSSSSSSKLSFELSQSVDDESVGFSCLSGRQFQPSQPHHILMYIDSNWYELSPNEEIPCVCAETGQASPLNSLGVQILLDRLLNPILGPEDPKTCESRMLYVCGEEATGLSLARLADSGAVSACFSVSDISVEDVMRVADARQLLPPKATCFQPKPLSGLFTHLH